MKMLFVLILGMLSCQMILSETNPGKQSCETSKFMACLKDFTSMNFIKKQSEITLQDIERDCSLVKRTEECVKPFIMNCHSDIIWTWTGTLSGLNYICQAPRKDVLEVAKCTLEHSKNLKQCIFQTFQTGFHHLKSSHNVEVDGRKSAICQAFGGWKKCLMNVESHFCGPKAKTMFEEIYNRMHAVLKTKLGCVEPPTTDEIAVDPPELCNSERFKKCLGDFMMNGRFDAFGDYSIESINNKCKMFETAKGCVWDFERHCQDHITDTWDAVRNAFNYLCSLPRSKVVKYAYCTTKHQHDLATCVQQTMAIQSYYIHTPHKNNLEAMCPQITSMEKCMVKVEKDECGKGASEIFHEMFERIKKIMVKRVCPLPEVLTVGQPGNTCKPDQFKECFADIPDIAQMFEGKLNEKNVLKICSYKPVISTCVEKFMSSCPEHMVHLWRAIYATTEYLCTLSTRKLVENGRCFFAHKYDFKICLSEIMRWQSSLLQENYLGSTQYRKMEVCRSVKRMETCFVHLQGHQCGKEAEIMYRNIFKIMNGIILPGRMCTEQVPHEEIDTCKPQQFKRCFGEIPSITSLFAGNLSEKGLRDICMNKPIPSSCIERFINSCPEHMVHLWRAIYATTEYFCTLSHKEVVQHGKCFIDHRNKFKTCLSELLKWYHVLLQEGYLGSPSYRKMEICRSVSQLETCFGYMKGHNCGKEADTMYRNVVTIIKGIIQSGDMCPKNVTKKPISKKTCQTDTFRKCLQDKQIHMVLFKQHLGDEEKLHELCQSIPELKNCYSEFREKCDEYCNVHMDGYLKALEKICAADRKVVVKAASCFMTYERVLDGCVQISLERHTHFLLSGRYYKKSRNQRHQLVCSTVTYGEKCRNEKIVTAFCGKEQTMVITEYLRVFNEYVTRKLGCERKRPPLTDKKICEKPWRKTLKIGLAVGVPLAVMLVIVVVLVAKKRKEKMQPKDRKFAVNINYVLENDTKNDIPKKY